MFSRRRPVAAAIVLAALLVIACGSDDDDGSTAVTGDNPSRESTSSPNLTMPVSRFALALPDLPQSYLTDRASTFVLDAATYGATRIFESPEQGEKLLADWGYVGGYETGFEPEQRDVGVLNGQYYVAVEVHLFKDTEGADRALDYFEEILTRQSNRVSMAGVGNRSSAWKVTNGKIPGSSIDATYHRVVFRRGNLVSVLKTYGSDVFMKVDIARALAVVVDEKALGEKPAVEPTPLTAETPAAR